MEAGEFARACPAIAESYRLDPRPGTLFTLAECEAKQGRIASAVAHYTDFLALVSRMNPEQQERQRDREKIATSQRSTLTPAIPLLTVRLPSNAPKDAVVKRDGVLLGAPSLGAALPVDPGVHTLSTQTGGQPERSEQFYIERGEKKEITLSFDISPPTPPLLKPAPMPVSRGMPPRRVWALAVGGVGIVGIGVGSVAGILAIGKKNSADEECPNVLCPNDEATAAAERAKSTGKTLGNISTIAFIVGGVGLAAGAILWFTAPKESVSKARRWSPTFVSDGRHTMVGAQGEW